MEIEYKRSQLKVKDYAGGLHTLRKPSAEEYKQFLKDVAGSTSETASVDAMKKIVTDCGLPEKTAGELEMDHLTDLFHTLVGVKKKQ